MRIRSLVILFWYSQSTISYTVYYIDFQNFFYVILFYLYISFHAYESTSNDSV
jgi:hypothetical protein